MKRGGRISICLIGAMALTLAARAVVNDSDNKSPDATSEGPYTAIWLRNVFDLKPTPPPAIEKPKPNEPPPNVTLTGITTMLGKKRALFMVKKTQQGKPPGKDESYILSEGQRQDQLEVLAINPTARTVKISIDGTESTITFETNKVSAGPQSMAAGVPPQPGGFPSPGFSPSGGGATRPLRGQGSYSSAGNLGGGYNQPSGYQPSGYQGGGGGYGGGVQTGYNPQPTVGGNTAVGAALGNALFGQNQTPAVAPVQVPQQPAMDPDVQKVIMAANAAAHAPEISAGTYPPMPPIPGLTAPPVEESNGQK